MPSTSVFYAHLLILHDIEAMCCLDEDTSVHKLDSVGLPHGEVLLHLLADLLIENMLVVSFSPSATEALTTPYSSVPGMLNSRFTLQSETVLFLEFLHKRYEMFKSLVKPAKLSHDFPLFGKNDETLVKSAWFKIPS